MFLGKGQSAAAGTDLNAHHSSLINRNIGCVDAGIRQRLAGRGQRKRNRSRDMLSVFCSKCGFPVKIANLARYLDGGIGNIETFDLSYTADPILQRLPKRLASDADGRGTTHSGNNDSAWA